MESAELLFSDSHCVQCGADIYTSTLSEMPFLHSPLLEGTNDVPSVQDREMAHKIAQNVIEIIASLDEELSCIDILASDLSAARKVVADRKDEIQAFGSAHRRIYCASDLGRRISLEHAILSRIFLQYQKLVLPHWPLTTMTPIKHVAPFQNDTYEPDSFSVSMGPLLFTGICRPWRKAALDTTTLWSNIVFVENRSKCPSAELIDLWIERAGQAPLTLTIKEMSSPYGPNSRPLFAKRDTHPAKARLMAYSERWGMFHYVCSPREVLESVANSTFSFKGKLPLLRTLTLQNRAEIQDAEYFTREYPSVHQSPFDAPLLERLTILDWPAHYLSSIAFPLSQLKTLILGIPYRLPYNQAQNTVKVSVFFDILSNGLLLDDLIITCGPWSPQDLPCGVTNNHLTRLNLTLDPKCSGDFLGRITLPALLDLQLLAFPGPIDDPTGKAIQSLCKRSPQLKAIEMVTGDISGAVVAGCLANAPKGLTQFKVLFLATQLDDVVQCLQGLSPTSFSPIVRRCLMFWCDGAFGMVATVLGSFSESSHDNLQEGKYVFEY